MHACIHTKKSNQQTAKQTRVHMYKHTNTRTYKHTNVQTDKHIYTHNIITQPPSAALCSSVADGRSCLPTCGGLQHGWEMLGKLCCRMHSSFLRWFRSSNPQISSSSQLKNYGTSKNLKNIVSHFWKNMHLNNYNENYDIRTIVGRLDL